MVIANTAKKVLLGQRSQFGWQFPQGGIKPEEGTEQAMYRELHEEVGLTINSVKILGRSAGTYTYEIPRQFRERLTQEENRFRGQNQTWFLLGLIDDTRNINLKTTRNPEFISTDWVSYWYPVYEIIDFKRKVYQQALKELAPSLAAWSS